MIQRFASSRSLSLLLVLLLAPSLRAELCSLEIVSREPFADGMAFGDVGPYERIVGTGAAGAVKCCRAADRAT